jgi:RNA polymerase sigma factor (sigma-70 family)
MCEPPRGRTLLESNFDLIWQRLQALGRRSGLPDHEADEFVSWALSKLVDNEYRMLGGWEGRSSFSTYLTVVLVNLMRDYRIHVWGKWRASASARRQGPEATLLERLLVRDGLSLDEAIRQMRTHGVALSATDIEKIAMGLPGRTDRRRVDEEELHKIIIDGRVEERVEMAESARAAARLRNVLLPLLRDLSAESRRLLKLYYRDGLTMAAISRMLGRPQKELYRFHERCLKKLRRHLEDAGLGAREVGALIGTPWDVLVDEAGVWE